MSHNIKVSLFKHTLFGNYHRAYFPDKKLFVKNPTIIKYKTSSSELNKEGTGEEKKWGEGEFYIN